MALTALIGKLVYIGSTGLVTTYLCITGWDIGFGKETDSPKISIFRIRRPIDFGESTAKSRFSVNRQKGMKHDHWFENTGHLEHGHDLELDHH